LSLTIIYSLRLYYYLFFIKSLNYLSVSKLSERKLINLSRVLLVLIMIVRGSLLNWLFFFNLEGIYLRIFNKFLTIIMLIIGELVCLGRLMIKVSYIKYLNIFTLMIWNLNFIYIYMD